MHRSSGAAAGEVVHERLDCFPDLSMFEEEDRYASGEDDACDDDIIDVSHHANPIISRS